MRSLYLRILIASGATVVLSVAALAAIFYGVSQPSITRKVQAFEDVLADDAADVYTRNGPSAVNAYLERIEAAAPTMKRYLVDANGRDVVTGEDRSEALRLHDAANGRPGRDREGHDILVHRSSDGNYRMVISAVPVVGLRDLAPYIALILSAVAFVCWWLAVGIASPIRDMVSVVNAFGHGRLEVRAPANREDEVGDLGRAFNVMAARIEALVSAERRLLQDVSHELRSPLTRLSMGVELSRTSGDPEAAADRLQRDVTRLSQLVGDLIDATRQEGDVVATPHDAVDVPSVLWSVVSDCEVEAHARGCRLSVETVPAWHTTGNVELLRRAFENVVRNAIRHAPTGTTVDVSCEASSNAAVVAVRDFGPGVPEEALADLGNPFFRVDTSRDQSTGGVGLGLAIARRAVQLHHGTWSVENAHPGLRVTITLPVA